MNAAPTPILAAIYWLHLLATVAWIGSLGALSLIFIPSARKALSPEEYSSLIKQIGGRLQQIGWLSLLILSATGMFQMSSSPAYQGFLAIENSWSLAILLKHIAVGAMFILSAVQTWGLNPALQRLALRRIADPQADPQKFRRLQKQEQLLLTLNLWIAVVVLALTAWARVS